MVVGLGTTPNRSPVPSPANPKQEWEPLFSAGNPPKSSNGNVYVYSPSLLPAITIP